MEMSLNGGDRASGIVHVDSCEAAPRKQAIRELAASIKRETPTQKPVGQFLGHVILGVVILQRDVIFVFPYRVRFVWHVANSTAKDLYLFAKRRLQLLHKSQSLAVVFGYHFIARYHTQEFRLGRWHHRSKRVIIQYLRMSSTRVHSKMPRLTFVSSYDIRMLDTCMARSNGPKLASEDRAIASNARWFPRNQHRSVAFYWVRFAAEQIVVNDPRIDGCTDWRQRKFMSTPAC